MIQIVKKDVMKPYLAALCMMLVMMPVLLSGCRGNSYSNQLRSEKKVIDEYIKLHKLNIIHEEPDYEKWGANDYLEIGDYCYFHLTVMGDTTTETVETKDKINLRYKKYGLKPNSDTLSYWNTNELPEPIEFQYNVSSSAACTGWHKAIEKMKYSGSEGVLICPSKLGFQNDASTVTPYGYILKIQIRRF